MRAVKLAYLLAILGLGAFAGVCFMVGSRSHTPPDELQRRVALGSPPVVKPAAKPPTALERARGVIKRRCGGCHGGEEPKGGLNLKTAKLAEHADKILARITSRDKNKWMPPFPKPLALPEYADLFEALRPHLTPKDKADGDKKDATAKKDAG